MINVLLSQNRKDLLKGELGSSSKTCSTSTVVGNEVNDIESEMVLDITEEVDHDPTTITAIKTETNVSSVPMVSVTHILYRLYRELPACVSFCPCETNILL